MVINLIEILQFLITGSAQKYKKKHYYLTFT